MTVEEAVLARLQDVSAVTAIVGDRIYLDKLPQSPTYPAVRVLMVDDPKGQHLRGTLGTTRGRVQVDAYVSEEHSAAPYVDIAALTEAIEGDGNGPSASGLFGWIGSIDGIRIVNVQHAAGRRRQYDPLELQVLTMILDYYVWYRV